MIALAQRLWASQNDRYRWPTVQPPTVSPRSSEDGRKAVGLFNLGESEAVVTVKWSDLGLTGRYIVRDLWRQKDLGPFDGQFSAPVGRHGVVLVSIRPVARLLGLRKGTGRRE